MPLLRVNEYDMTYVESGSGPILLLLHGTLCDYRIWRPQMEAFGARYRTIAVSLRHCWPETWDGEGDDFTIQQHIADVVTLVRALSSGPIDLLGLSRGGHIAFRVAQYHPTLVHALVLAEPGGVLDAELEAILPPGPPTIPLGPLYAGVAEKIRSGAIDEGLAPAVETLLGPGAWSNIADELKQMLRDNAKTMLGQVKEQRAPFSRADAEAIRAPTLFLVGERSPTSFYRIIDALRSAMPTSEKRVIQNASHASNLDNPEAFNSEVLEFLGRHLARTAH